MFIIQHQGLEKELFEVKSITDQSKKGLSHCVGLLPYSCPPKRGGETTFPDKLKYTSTALRSITTDANEPLSAVFVRAPILKRVGGAALPSLAAPLLSSIVRRRFCAGKIVNLALVTIRGNTVSLRREQETQTGEHPHWVCNIRPVGHSPHAAE